MSTTLFIADIVFDVLAVAVVLGCVLHMRNAVDAIWQAARECERTPFPDDPLTDDAFAEEREARREYARRFEGEAP